jgi:diamine N-acetyltransferase
MQTAIQPSDLNLRAIEPTDVDKLYLWENNPEIQQAGGVRAPMSRHQLWEYANNYDANPFSAGQLRLIIELKPTADGSQATDSQNKATAEGGQQPTVCGVVDLYDVDAVNLRAMVGIMVAPQYRNRGIASGALTLLEAYCRDLLGLHSLGAEVAADNQPSLALFSRCAYSHVGTRPQWYRRRNRFVDARLLQKPLNSAR